MPKEIERYCPSKIPMWEHDNECYYHGPLLVCPLCGTVTKPCMSREYEPIKVEGLGDVTPGIVYKYRHESEVPFTDPYWDSEL